MTIRNSFPDVRPALNLDFANTKRLDPRITFTRSSTGTYVDEFGVIKTAASNEARFDHDSDGNSLGLLIEESRTNLITYSEQFDNAAWIKTRSTINANVSTAPDGTLTADEVVATNNNAYVSGGVTLTAATYTASIYARANTATSVTLYLATSALALGASCVFDLSNGTVGSITHYGSSTGFSSSIQALPGGWYRCSITGLCTAALWYHQVGIFNNQNNSMYFWGAQLEQGSFPTSYIPTSGSTVTRAVDITTMTGTNFSSWFNPNEGTLQAQASALSPTYQQYIFRFWQGGGPAAIALLFSGSGARPQFYIDTNNNPPGNRYNNMTVGTYGAIMAGAYKLQDSAAAAGGALTTNTANGLPANLSQVQIGRAGTAQQLSGHISRLTYYDRRLTDAQLQALTL